MFKNISVLFFLGLFVLGGCAMTKQPPLRTEKQVDLNRYMGEWYVIAAIPLSVEKDAYNALESYRLDEKGAVPTTFTFNKGAFDGEKKTYKSKAFVRDKNSNAVWGVQFIWPFKAEYRIMYLNSDYSQTIVGRTKRDYVWLMARTPVISEADYQARLKLIEEEGYDISKIRKVPQQNR
jgi:apolipoprotein D and lipocalin family protein